MDKIPGIHKQPESDPDIPQDAESDDPGAIVDNLPDELFEDAWNAEVSSWMELGLNPGQNITIDQFLFKSRLEVLISILIEAGIIKPAEFNDQVRRYMLKTMIQLRREFGRQMLHAQLTQGVHMPSQAKPDMFLPNDFKKL